MNKVREIIRQKFGRRLGYRKIAGNLNISISTVADYVARAKVAGITSWPLPEGLSDQDLQYKLFGEPKPEAKEKKSAKIDWDWTHKELKKKGVTRQLIWQELKEVHSDFISYAQFCWRYRRHAKTLDPVMRQTHKAGEKCFVDYAGTTMSFVDSKTGEIVKAEIFVGCLGASSYTYVEATLSQQRADWIGSNKRMFEFFGGSTEVLIPDNLKSGVKKAHRYDPVLNPAYQEFGLHYNVAIVPARAAAPKDKAAVESAVGFVTRQILAPLRHTQFYSLGALNEAIWKRLKILNECSFQKKNTSRQALFDELDKPALQPLPITPFEYGDWKKAKINIDYHFAYDDHHYSVPYQHCGRHVMLRASANTIECFLENERIAVHARSYRKYHHTTFGAHMPTSHYEHAKWTPETIVEWAIKIGSNTTKLLKNIIEGRDFPQQAFGTCLGVLRLAKTYGNERLEKASAKALLVGMTRQSDIKEMLKNKLEDMPIESTALPPPIHNNIRGPEYFQSVSSTQKEGVIKC